MCTPFILASSCDQAQRYEMAVLTLDEDEQAEHVIAKSGYPPGFAPPYRPRVATEVNRLKTGFGNLSRKTGQVSPRGMDQLPARWAIDLGCSLASEIALTTVCFSP